MAFLFILARCIINKLLFLLHLFVWTNLEKKKCCIVNQNIIAVSAFYRNGMEEDTIKLHFKRLQMVCLFNEQSHCFPLLVSLVVHSSQFMSADVWNAWNRQAIKVACARCRCDCQRESLGVWQRRWLAPQVSNEVSEESRGHVVKGSVSLWSFVVYSGSAPTWECVLSRSPSLSARLSVALNATVTQACYHFLLPR